MKDPVLCGLSEESETHRVWLWLVKNRSSQRAGQSEAYKHSRLWVYWLLWAHKGLHPIASLVHSLPTPYILKLVHFVFQFRTLTLLLLSNQHEAGESACPRLSEGTRRGEALLLGRGQHYPLSSGKESTALDKESLHLSGGVLSS